MLDVHYFGTVFVTRAAWPHFVSAGYGRVVNTVSEAMLGGIPELTSYGAAKGAVFGLTRNLATEGRPTESASTRSRRAHSRGCPPRTRMPWLKSMSLPKEVMDQINDSMPPEMCAPAAVFLAHESCPLNGEVLQVGMGGVSRIAVVHSQGINKTALTAEDIAENLDQVMDLSDAYVDRMTSLQQE